MVFGQDVRMERDWEVGRGPELMQCRVGRGGGEKLRGRSEYQKLGHVAALG